MAYDLHLGKNREEAMYTPRAFTIGDYEHDALFEEVENYIDKNWIFFRIQDFYRDAEISAQEIPSLIKEIDDLATKTSNPKIIHLLRDLKQTCEKSIRKNENMYFFAD